MNVAGSPSLVERSRDESTTKFLKLPPKSRSPSRGPIVTATKGENLNSTTPRSSNKKISDADSASDLTPPDISSSQREPCSPRFVPIHIFSVSLTYHYEW